MRTPVSRELELDQLGGDDVNVTTDDVDGSVAVASAVGVVTMVPLLELDSMVPPTTMELYVDGSEPLEPG